MSSPGGRSAALAAIKRKKNAGRELQQNWRWNGRPVLIRITLQPDLKTQEVVWHIDWFRWFDGPQKWRPWRGYVGTGTLREVIARYRDYADGWRGTAW